MKFPNRENERVELPDGRVIYLSRAVAVAYQLHAVIDEEHYVLVCKRGSEAIGGPGKWCLPCGYLDWDELADGAVIRTNNMLPTPSIKNAEPRELEGVR